ncbi:hypothetical protein NDU88_003120 [Pleurodeles waltl]|uniref:Uncharacterized protein n=1 Tax=Pleurodeles waltl TaxID=8319 RepID=A0AAV7VD47_PLEWA|nr:hypothetical protein NDU88_003120 [Pleurodeles waltl]
MTAGELGTGPGEKPNLTAKGGVASLLARWPSPRDALPGLGHNPSFLLLERLLLHSPGWASPHGCRCSRPSLFRGRWELLVAGCEEPVAGSGLCSARGGWRRASVFPPAGSGQGLRNG